jgi:hypothetical protein
LDVRSGFAIIGYCFLASSGYGRQYFSVLIWAAPRDACPTQSSMPSTSQFTGKPITDHDH